MIPNADTVKQAIESLSGIGETTSAKQSNREADSFNRTGKSAATTGSPKTIDDRKKYNDFRVAQSIYVEVERLYKPAKEKADAAQALSNRLQKEKEVLETNGWAKHIIKQAQVDLDVANDKLKKAKAEEEKLGDALKKAKASRDRAASLL